MMPRLRLEGSAAPGSARLGRTYSPDVTTALEVLLLDTINTEKRIPESPYKNCTLGSFNKSKANTIKRPVIKLGL
ncbi:hypothetical protein KPH14_004289 [Odynerus spinipes]|uniref:Uncharacterized protein n=1 Tax=Odynerus spinipes TaxID=1348599 RepID=A0AAD9VW84_9HYME|nr:hypothetical protein KPH14_004289 [Odynerus spinipes]